MTPYSSNISIVIGGMSARLQGLVENPDPLLRTVALTVLPEVKKRVHVQGLDSSGSLIGTYSPGYLALRTGNYSNADKFKKGARQGQHKNAGTHTKGNSAGSVRPQYHRDADPKVILSLTRQMENDMSVLPNGKAYGIGYNNPENYQKSQWNEATYKKAIWNLTESERELAQETAQHFTTDYLKQ